MARATMKSITIHCIVVAAGVGKRFGTALPKQYTPIHRQTVLQHSIKALSQVASIDTCYLVVSKEDSIANTLEYALPIHWVIGGAERMHSVFNGVTAIWRTLDDPHDNAHWVLIHDAARPCVKPDDIEKLITQVLANESGQTAGGTLAVPVRDTVKQITTDNGQVYSATTLDRNQLWLAQTPQLFPLQPLYHYLTQAIEQHIPFTDEASLFEHFGKTPLLVEGSHSNIKLTFPEDLLFAEAVLS